VDAERLRPAIEGRLGAALGRQVAIGKLRFSWLAGGVLAEQISIADDPAFSAKPFVTAKALAVKVEIWPLLLHREIRMDSLSLQTPQLVLLRNGNRWNFSSLGAPSAAAASPPRPSATTGGPPQLVLKKFTLSNGQITLQQPGKAQTYSDLNLDASGVALDSAFPFHLSAQLPGNGKLTLDGKAGPVPKGDAAQIPVQASVQLEHLGLAAYANTGARLGGTAGLTANLQSDGRQAHVEGSTKLENLVLAQGGTPLREPVISEFAVDYSLVAQNGKVVRGDAHIGKSVVHLTGGFETRGADPVLSFTLAAPSLQAADIEQTLKALAVTLPGGVSLQGGSANANLAVAGPTSSLVSSGPVHVENLTVSGFNLSGQLRSIASLAGLHPGSDTRVQSFDAKVRVDNDGIRLDDVRAVVADMGTLTGAGTIGANHQLNFQLVAHLSGTGGMLGGLLQAAGGQLNTVPFRVEGTTSDPKFVPDLKSLVQNQKTSAPGQPQTPQNNPLGGLLNNFLKKKK